MRHFIGFTVAMLALAVVANQAKASSLTGLADWCVNLNGDVVTACNGAGVGGSSGPSPGGINLAAFDQTLEGTGTNALGQVVVNLSAGLSNQYSAFYADYDLNFVADGSFDDSASVHGALPAGFSYEIDDPNTGNVYTDFAGNTLSNQNNVGTPSGPPNQCCDVSFGLGVSGLNVPVGQTGTVTYTISAVAPVSGFYIQQTNATAGDSIYLSAVVNISGPGGPTVPEPSTVALGLGGLVLAVALARRRRVRA